MDTVQQVLTTGWRFRYGECEDAWYKGYDDSSWEEIMVPHDYSVTAPFSESYSSGTGYVRGGIAWYRRRITIPEEYRGKRILLVFDGIYCNSRIWVNSYYMGKRPYGYSEICLDITDLASFGEDATEVSVQVDHRKLADSRWFTGSGITRKVSLLISDQVTCSYHGIFFQTKEVVQEGDRRRAHVTIHNELTGQCTADSRIRNLLLDAEGETVLCLEGVPDPIEQSSPAGGLTATNATGQLTLAGCVENAHLWSPENPYLYTLRTEILHSGEVSVADMQKVGLRTFSFDPDQGFALNGVGMKFKGVCVHHDGGCLGAAMKKEVWRRRLELLKKCGCNAIRCSHNPHMPELYELCDELGFMVMDEAFDEWENAKNKWSTGHNVYPPRHQGYYEDFPVWHEADLRTMIRRDRNHPSVILYSVGNEIDYPNDPYCHPLFSEMTGNNDKNKPAKERQYDAAKPNMERLAVIAKRLAAIARDEDPSRPVTIAAAFPELSSRIGFLDPFDVVGYNYKEHLYEEDHRRFPGKTFLGSENGHQAEAWEAVRDHPYICGQFLWTGIDYLGEAQGWPIHGSGAGLITTAGFPKESFYQRCALWEGEGIADTYSAEPEAVRWQSAVESEDEHAPGYLYQIEVRGGNSPGSRMSQMLSEEVGDSTRTETDIYVQVSGAGELAGIDNGDLSDLTSYTADHRRTYHGNAIVYVRRTGDGPIRVMIGDAENRAQISLAFS